VGSRNFLELGYWTHHVEKTGRIGGMSKQNTRTVTEYQTLIRHAKVQLNCRNPRNRLR